MGVLGLCWTPSQLQRTTSYLRAAAAAAAAVDAEAGAGAGEGVDLGALVDWHGVNATAAAKAALLEVWDMPDTGRRHSGQIIMAFGRA